jgi:hypothetical protein
VAASAAANTIHRPLNVDFKRLRAAADAYARPDEIDKKTLEIRPVDDDVYSDVQSLADELPDHAPRFVLLSYPLTLVRCLWKQHPHNGSIADEDI